MNYRSHLVVFALLIILASCKKTPTTVEKSTLDSGTSSLLQAISIVNEEVAWVSGHKATFLRTVDAGINWESFEYKAIDSLQFRDVHAFDKDKIVLMSAGPGAMSRIFLFDPASGFKETYVMPHKEGFLNTIEFWDENRGLAFGDSFNGELFLLETKDGGASWQRVDPSLLPAAGEGEGGFAASGTCIAMRPQGKAWIATGAGGNSRVIMTDNFGVSWKVSEVPIIKGEAAGITSIRMIDDQVGSIVGGDLAITDQYTDNIAITKDGGETWELTKKPITKGAFYGSEFIEGGLNNILLISGPNGIDYSLDQGQTFVNLDSGNYWAVDLHSSGIGYAVGKGGEILKLSLE